MNLYQALCDMFRPDIELVLHYYSHKKKILNSLLLGNKLTVEEMNKKFNCKNPTARIAELRKADWNIVTRFIKDKHGKRVAVYSLEKYVI